MTLKNDKLILNNNFKIYFILLYNFSYVLMMTFLNKYHY